ncbi:MAG: hypothetical protein ABIL45_03730 [candidate division WOR-3 bacterium]
MIIGGIKNEKIEEIKNKYKREKEIIDKYINELKEIRYSNFLEKIDYYIFVISLKYYELSYLKIEIETILRNINFDNTKKRKFLSILEKIQYEMLYNKRKKEIANDNEQENINFVLNVIELYNINKEILTLRDTLQEVLKSLRAILYRKIAILPELYY